MRVLLIDDDPLVRAVLTRYLEKDAADHVIVEAALAQEALEKLRTDSFDLIFLDLQMPDVSGEQLLPVIPDGIPVVVVTAYADFAAKSYAYDVADYLLKPLEVNRFNQAMQKVRQRISSQTAANAVAAAEQPQELFVKTSGKIIRVDLNRVTVVEAEGNYLRILGDDPPVMTLLTMKKMEPLLPGNFLRVHRSFFINKNRISQIEDGIIRLGTQRVPVGDSYREGLMQRLGLAM